MFHLLYNEFDSIHRWKLHGMFVMTQTHIWSEFVCHFKRWAHACDQQRAFQNQTPNSQRFASAINHTHTHLCTAVHWKIEGNSRWNREKKTQTAIRIAVFWFFRFHINRIKFNFTSFYLNDVNLIKYMCLFLHLNTDYFNRI